jgi:hypothetical protein
MSTASRRSRSSDLFDHLRASTGLEPSPADIGDIFELIPALRLAARIALARGEYVAAAHPTLGELYLVSVSGDQAAETDRDEALAHYAVAARFPVQRRILRERLDLFGALGFRPTLVSAAQAPANCVRVTTLRVKRKLLAGWR